MLRQSGAIVNRLVSSGMLQASQASGAKMFGTAMFSNQVGVAGQLSVQPGAFQVAANQFSPEAAAALAGKMKHINGLGGANLNSSKAFSTFSMQGAAATAAPAADAKKPSLLQKMAKAFAVIAGAVALAASPALADSPEPWQWGFQDMATSTGQAAVDLHHDINFFVITVVVLVCYLFAQFATKFHYTKQLRPEKFTHHTTLEVIWTVIPTLIVLSIAIPSLTLIYSMDQQTDRPGLTVKVIGRQWYWSYEMHDHLQHKLLDPDRLVAIAEKSLTK